jgi:hypothetical protein
LESAFVSVRLLDPRRELRGTEKSRCLRIHGHADEDELTGGGRHLRGASSALRTRAASSEGE